MAGKAQEGEGRVPASPSRLLAGLSNLNTRLESLFENERDQLPLWLPVGLGLGIAAWFALPDSQAWCAFLLGAGAVMLGAFSLAPGSRWGRALAIFALLVPSMILGYWVYST